MSDLIKRIAVIGPESSGKSELCQKLAALYQTRWVPEFARIYLSNLEHHYTIDDIVKIYETQFQQEQELSVSAVNYIFTDTEFIIAKVWCENSFKKCPGYIDEMIKAHPYDLYLLTAPDLPWVYDPLRENPGKGDFFFKWYVRLLEENNFNYGIVSGTNEQRTGNAVAIIEQQFSKTKGLRLH